MKLVLKEPITTKTGVTYPAGYELACDTLMNLQSGFTSVGVLEQVKPGLFINEEAFTIGVRDLHKIEVKLEFPA